MKKLYFPFFTLLFSVSVSAQWLPVADMNAIRKDHVLFALHSGKVLAAGGWTGAMNLVTSEWLNAQSASPSWTASINEMSVSHTTGAGVVLEDGKALIVGGFTGSANTAICELYDTNSHTWTNAESLNIGRSYHTATLLANGKVLVTGGFDGTTNLNSCELYDPATNTWSLVPNGLATGRSYHTATLMNGGRVLIAGGFNPVAGFQLNSVEIYNPTSNTFAAGPSLANTRAYHGATLLNNGKVFIAGGENFNGGSPFAYNGMTGCEIFDPAANAWTSATNMPFGAAYNKLFAIANNKVLMVAGASNTNYSPSFSFSPGTTLVYDVTANSWTETPMTMDGRVGFAAAKISNEKILVAGGIDQNGAELFETSTSTSLSIKPGEFAFRAFPSPTKDIVFVSTNSDEVGTLLLITDVLGRKMNLQPTRTQENHWKFDLTGFQKGLYRITLIRDSKLVANQVVVLQ